MAERVTPTVKVVADKTADKDNVEEVEETVEEVEETDEADEATDEDTKSESEKADEAADEDTEVVVVEESTKPAVILPPVAGVKSAIKPEEPLAIGAAVPDQNESDDQNAVSDHILDSPQKFGIWIDGELHQFQKGKQRLTKRQLKACLEHRYVRDNGAQVLKLVKSKPKAK